MASIGPNHAMILRHDANPKAGWNFRKGQDIARSSLAPLWPNDGPVSVALLLLARAGSLRQLGERVACAPSVAKLA